MLIFLLSRDVGGVEKYAKCTVIIGEGSLSLRRSELKKMGSEKENLENSRGSGMFHVEHFEEKSSPER